MLLTSTLGNRAKRVLFGPNRFERARRLTKRWLREIQMYRRREPVWCFLPQEFLIKSALSKGFWMRLDPNQPLDRSILLQGVWDPALTMFLQQYIQAGDTCIDIGAHKGYVSCLLASLIGGTGMVLSFEPDPRAFSSLLQNFERNEFGHTQAYPLAIGAHDGAIKLTLTRTIGCSSQYPNSLASSDAIGPIMVECSRFDTNQTFKSTLATREALSFLKIDAEGSEPEIWQGMVETILCRKPLISMEINYQSLAAGGFDIRKFEQQIKQAGYTEFFEPVIVFKEDGLRPSHCVLRRIDITDERPLLVETIISNPASSFRNRIAHLIE